MKSLLYTIFIFAALLAAQVASYAQQNPIQLEEKSQLRHGPENGTLVIIGGGVVTDEIWERFIALAGGENARIVVITNASGDGEDYHSKAISEIEKRIGAKNVTRMHLKSIDEAADEKNIGIIAQATGIYFTGGRQWRIADVYLNTPLHREFNRLLQRGGVIAGSSAGASIQGSFLWRGDTRGAQILIGDHTQGLGFMRRTAIDQHILVRNRQNDLAAFIKAAPEYIGIGIDESTAIVVVGDEFEVIGSSYVAVHCAGQENYLMLRPGQKYNLKEHKRINRSK